MTRDETAIVAVINVYKVDHVRDGLFETDYKYSINRPYHSLISASLWGDLELENGHFRFSV